MEYKQLGGSGIPVSTYGLGVMTFGGQTPEEDAFRQLDMALAAGITLFDTAENYPMPSSPETQGRSEEMLGRWVATRGVRNRVVIATKVAGPGNPAGDLRDTPGMSRYLRGESRRLDRANIREAVEDSLRRLGVDTIDLYQVHWPERPITTTWRSRYSYLPPQPGLTPIEDTLAVLGELVNEGKVRAIGVCNESPYGVMRYLGVAEQRGLPRLSSSQNSYSLLDRYYDLGLAEIGMSERVGLIAYSPLAMGTLTGKYGTTPAPLPGSRSSQIATFLPRLLSQGKQQAIRAYVELARAHGLDPAHMALAFVRQQPFTASVLMAASSATQLETNLGAIDITLPKELMQAINAVHDANANPK